MRVFRGIARMGIRSYGLFSFLSTISGLVELSWRSTVFFSLLFLRPSTAI